MPDTQEVISSNEINVTGKVIAGLSLVTFTLFPIWILIAYWPNKIPESKQNIKPLYLNTMYNVRLVCIPDSLCERDTFFLKSASTKLQTVGTTSISDTTLHDTTTQKPKSKNTTATIPANDIQSYYVRDNLIDLSTLILILVAAAGFLGNMIHVATSFTTFIGAGRFKRNWILWYCIKPFTAAALAIGLYFVFRGGFMNYSADPSSVNLYGILTISLLTGLFTDRATLKLGEVFDVIFSVKKDLKNNDPRPDKLINTALRIITSKPDKIDKTKTNEILLTGENLDKQPLVIKINDETLPADLIKITTTTITISYVVPASQVDKTEFKMQIFDANNKELFTKAFTV